MQNFENMTDSIYFWTGYEGDSKFMVSRDVN